jgi:hypothetical protein
MRPRRGAGEWYFAPPSPSGDFYQKRNLQMSSSNLAVRMEHTATDLLSNPPRISLRLVANNERPVQSGPRISFTNRKFVIRDQGFGYFRIR